MSFRILRKTAGWMPSWWLSAVVLVLVLASCSIVEPDEDKIQVVNETGVPLVFLVMELQASYLFDPAPTIPVDPNDPRVLLAGASRSLLMEDVSGGFSLGDDIRFFLYEVVGDTAESRSILTLTAEDLEDADFRVPFNSF